MRGPLDVERLARAFVHVIDRKPTKVEVTYFYGDDIPVEVQREGFLRDIAAEYARLTTSEPVNESPERRAERAKGWPMPDHDDEMGG
jgi:hypothetical protein